MIPVLKAPKVRRVILALLARRVLLARKALPGKTEHLAHPVPLVLLVRKALLVLRDLRVLPDSACCQAGSRVVRRRRGRSLI